MRVRFFKPGSKGYVPDILTSVRPNPHLFCMALSLTRGLWERHWRYCIRTEIKSSMIHAKARLNVAAFFVYTIAKVCWNSPPIFFAKDNPETLGCAMLRTVRTVDHVTLVGSNGRVN